MTALMPKGNDIRLDVHEDAIRVQKKNIPVVVRFEESDGICNTKEGHVSYKAGDAILTGVEGEQCPIERERFDATYKPVSPTLTDENGAYAKKPIPVYALQMQEEFYVKVSWGDNRLKGQAGDWLVQYGENDYGIVGKPIFEKTYEMLKMTSDEDFKPVKMSM